LRKAVISAAARSRGWRPAWKAMKARIQWIGCEGRLMIAMFG